MDPSTALYFRYANRLDLKKRITTLFRLVEVVTLTLIAFWSSARIPTAARSSADLIRHVIPVLVGPHFLFLIANAIVLSLLFLRPAAQSAAHEKDKKVGIADEMITAPFDPPPPRSPAREDEVAFEDKGVCVEEAAAAEPPPPHRKQQQQQQVRRACRRSGSGRMNQGERRRRSSELRRAETDVGKLEGKANDEEEFRRMVEAFIEKHWKFQREESMAIVCSAEDGGAGFNKGGGTE